MFGKILKFARPDSVHPVQAPCPEPVTVSADELMRMEYADTVPDTLSDTVEDPADKGSKSSAAAATREFLNIVMAETWELFTRAGHPVPQELKLTTALWRYQILRSRMRWPYQDKSQLAKNLVACGCKSHRRTTKTGKVGMIEFPAYPAAALPEAARKK